MVKKFTRDTPGSEVVTELANKVDGRTFVITGAGEKGLGAETAISLAYANPAHIILNARSQPRVESVISRIKELNPKIKVTFVPLSLDDLDSVRAAASKIDDSVDKLDVLINNAGIMDIEEYTTNKAGIEIQFATNHVGHFFFTKLLFLKILAAAPGSRIVNLTSYGHRLSPVRFGDWNFSNGKDYDGWSGYGQSKSANILFSKYLAERLGPKGIQSYAVHPGSIYGTNLGIHINDIPAALALTEAVAKKNTGNENFLKDLEQPKSIEAGVNTTLVAALDPRIEPLNGAYLADAEVNEPAEHVKSLGDAERLWTLSEDLVGAKFDI